jgi:hypothetical protein
MPAAPPSIAGGDLCGPQVTVFVAAGDLFGAPPRRAGPPSAEELARELARENAAIERLQIAFDALLYCRWTEVRVIRAEASAGEASPAETQARLAAANGRLRQDVGRASAFRQQIEARAARIEATAEQVSPGLRAAALRARAAPESNRGMASAPVTLRLRPDAAAAVSGRLEAGTEVALRPAAGGFAFVEAAGRITGYAPGSAFTLLPPAAAAGDDSPLRRLVATNIARRDTFVASLAVAERSEGAGFEFAR